MIIGPVDNLHGEQDICKSKAGKFFARADYSDRKPDNAALLIVPENNQLLTAINLFEGVVGRIKNRHS